MYKITPVFEFKNSDWNIFVSANFFSTQQSIFLDRLTIILSNFSSFGFLIGTLGPLSEVLPAVLNKNQAETNIVSSTALIVLCFASEYRVPNRRRVCQKERAAQHFTYHFYWSCVGRGIQLFPGVVEGSYFMKVITSDVPSVIICVCRLIAPTLPWL